MSENTPEGLGWGIVHMHELDMTTIRSTELAAKLAFVTKQTGFVLEPGRAVTDAAAAIDALFDSVSNPSLPGAAPSTTRWARSVRVAVTPTTD